MKILRIAHHLGSSVPFLIQLLCIVLIQSCSFSLSSPSMLPPQGFHAFCHFRQAPRVPGITSLSSQFTPVSPANLADPGTWNQATKCLLNEPNDNDYFLSSSLCLEAKSIKSEIFIYQTCPYSDINLMTQFSCWDIPKHCENIHF